MKTQFSGFGEMPTGELKDGGQGSSSLAVINVCGPDVCLHTSFVPFFSARIERKMYCLMWCRFLCVEVLYKCGVGIQGRSSGVPIQKLTTRIHGYKTRHLPSNDDFLRVHFVVQIIHLVMIIHVDCDLLCGLTMQDCKCRSYFNFSRVGAGSKKRANNPFLCICPSEVVVEDGE